MVLFTMVCMVDVDNSSLGFSFVIFPFSPGGG